MNKRIKSIKGLFGQTIHYEDGIKVGESWSGLLSGSQNHYDAESRYIGYSDRGIIADLVHYDKKGGYAGETYEGIWGQKKHFDAGGGYIGETWEGMVGEDSDFQDDCRLSNVLDTDDFVEGNGW